MGDLKGGIVPHRVLIVLSGVSLAGALLIGACDTDDGATVETLPATTTTATPPTTAASTTTKAGPSEGTQITLSLEGVVGVGGLTFDAWVVPLVGNESVVLGEAHFQNLGDDPYAVSGVIRPEPLGRPDEAVKFPPGEYRFIIEAYVPSGEMRYGCERQIVTQTGYAFDTLVLTSIPEYTGNSLSWTTDYDTLAYPHCPMWP